MGIAAYQYVSDDGGTYQVLLPSDFALALGYISATGSEPYLPSYVAPRTATYQSVAGLLWASVVITAPFNQYNPPLTFGADSNIYHLLSASGETRNGYISSNIIQLAGPTGPPGGIGPDGPPGPAGPQGPGGALLNVNGQLSNSDIIGAITTPKILIPAPGESYGISPLYSLLRFWTAGGVYSGAGGCFLQLGGGYNIPIDVTLFTGGDNYCQQLILANSFNGGGWNNQPLTINLGGLNPGPGGSLFYSINYTIDQMKPG